MSDYQLYENEFLKALETPNETQEALLLAILAQNSECEFGRTHGFANIKTIKDYRSSVPAQDYSGFKPYIDRMEEGEANVLFKGVAEFFAETSGTEAKSKLIPYSSETGDEHRRYMFPYLGAIARQFPGAIENGMILLGPYDVRRTIAGSVVGVASGYVRHIGDGLPPFSNLPLAISDETRTEVRLYCTLRLALSFPLTMLFAANPSPLVALFRAVEEMGEALCEDLERGTICRGPEGSEELLRSINQSLPPTPEKALLLRKMLLRGPFLPEEYWPSLKLLTMWRGGTTAHTVRALEALCPNTTIHSAVSGASEGGFLIPLAQTWLGGLPALMSTVFEFIPEKSDPADCNAYVPLLELKAGTPYLIVITNSRGLYRLALNDVFFVDGAHRGVPLLRLSHRQGTSSIAGEKLTEQQLSKAIDSAATKASVVFEEYQLAPLLDELPAYVLMVEQPAMATSSDEALLYFLECLDGYLRQYNTHYDRAREGGRLGHPTLRVLAQGQLMTATSSKRRSRPTIQTKIRRLELEQADTSIVVLRGIAPVLQEDAEQTSHGSITRPIGQD